MTPRFWIRLAEVGLTLLLAAAVILSWREARSDRAELQTQLAAANQALSAATDRQHDRDAKLNDTLANIAAEKKAAATPDQLLAGIAREIGLPTPLQLQAVAVQSAGPTTHGTDKSKGKPARDNPLQPSAAQPGPSPTSQSTSLASTPATNPSSGSAAGPAQDPSSATFDPPSAPEAKIPAADLRPLYNYVLDCKACQAKLAAAQADLADEKSKTATLTKSRDDAVRAAKGGSIWKRAVRAAKWFAIGAAAGAIAAKTVR